MDDLLEHVDEQLKDYDDLLEDDNDLELEMMELADDDKLENF